MVFDRSASIKENKCPAVIPCLFNFRLNFRISNAPLREDAKAPAIVRLVLRIRRISNSPGGGTSKLSPSSNIDRFGLIDLIPLSLSCSSFTSDLYVFLILFFLSICVYLCVCVCVCVRLSLYLKCRYRKEHGENTIYYRVTKTRKIKKES